MTARARFRRTFLVRLLAAAFGLFQAATAGAATAVVEPTDIFFGLDTVRYVADAGEANRVTISPSVSFAALEITDAGATITAGAGCTSLAPNKVRCVYQDDFIEVALGDSDDLLSLSSNVVSSEAVFRGQDGDDRIVAGGGTESLEYLFGGLGNDTLRGRAGNDVLSGGGGADTLRGGTSLQFQGLRIFEPNIDTVTYATRSNDVFADPDGIADDGEAGEADMIGRDVERLVGGSGNDVLVGATAKGRIQGRQKLFGAVLKGRRGNDVLRGSRAGDTLDGEPGHDVLRGNRGEDLLRGRRGDDRLAGGPGGDALNAGDGNDRLVGGRGRDRFLGGDGRDLLLARDGRAEFVDGGRWKDSARIDEGLDRVRRIETILP